MVEHRTTRWKAREDFLREEKKKHPKYFNEALFMKLRRGMGGYLIEGRPIDENQVCLAEAEAEEHAQLRQEAYEKACNEIIGLM